MGPRGGAAVSSRRPRVLAPREGVPGPIVTLDAEETHHLIRVLRAHPGDPLEVFDGAGRGWDAVLEGADRDAARVRVVAERTDAVESPLPVTLIQGSTRPERIEWVLQKGAEVGVASFRIFRAARSEGPSPSPSRLERYRRILLEACKQCGRRAVPELRFDPELPVPLPGVATWVLDPVASLPLGEPLRGAAPAGLAIVTGPEGGFEAEELSKLEAGGAVRVSLGPRILRTETAGVIAATLAIHRWGDLGAAARA